MGAGTLERVHGLKMVVRVNSENVRAYCTCMWRTERVADIRTAKQALDAHVKERV